MSVLVYGCNGSLGSAIVKCLRRSKPAWCIVGVDVAHSTSVHHSIQISPSNAMFPNRQAPELISSLDRALPPSDKKLDAIVCVSGGFTMGSAKAPELLEGVEDMFSRSVFPSFISAQLAALYLRPGGLLVLPGAAVGNTPTPWGLSYGSSKAAVHHLVRSLSHPGADLPNDVTVVGVAPTTLDTEANRRAMPDADRSTWTPLEALAGTVCEWIATPSLCASGVIYKVETKAGQTTYVPMA